MKYMIIGLFLLFAGNIHVQVQETVKDSAEEATPGTSVFWMNTGQGVTIEEDDSLSITKSSRSHMLIASFIGFQNNTIRVDSKDQQLDTVFRDGVELNEVNIVTCKLGTMKLCNSMMNEDMISSAELSRATCCNLDESFVTNPSVDVSYSDVAAGAKQIELLGLSGAYVQMLTENIPNYRRTAAPHGLGYIPGPQMQSIQVSKGTSSVKNSYRTITGQINVESKKSQLPGADWASANLFVNTTNRYEANASATLKLSKRWSISLLAHHENGAEAHDGSDDRFMDVPQVEQCNVWSRWVHMGDHYASQAGIRAPSKIRTSGQANHRGTMYSGDLHKVGIDTERYEFFTRDTHIFNKEKNTNLALILSTTLHNQDATHGRKLCSVDQANVYTSLMFETEFNPQNSFSAGPSFNYDTYGQHHRLENTTNNPPKTFEKEAVPGAYAQYTLNLNDRWMVMASLCGDYSNEYGFFMIPCMHLKYSPNDYVSFRLSAGEGYRTNRVLAENNYLLSSSRKVEIAKNLDMEETWNYGVSVSTYIPVPGKTPSVNAEYYYTDSPKQVIVDMDSNPYEVVFYNLDGHSYLHVFQVGASYPFSKGFTLTGAHRFADAKTTYKDGRMEKPLTSKYKRLLIVSYQTPLEIWQFDATLRLNGGGRTSIPYKRGDGQLSWGRCYGGFEQLSLQVTRYFHRWSIYVGGENLTNFKQKNPTTDAANPWGDNFDSIMIWELVHGAEGYIGVRFNLARNSE